VATQRSLPRIVWSIAALGWFHELANMHEKLILTLVVTPDSVSPIFPLNVPSKPPFLRNTVYSLFYVFSFNLKEKESFKGFN
jgi:hypothetical protein